MYATFEDKDTPTWEQIEAMARDPDKALILRKDVGLLNKIIVVLQTDIASSLSPGQFSQIEICLRILALILQNSNSEDYDIMKSSSIPALLIDLLAKSVKLSFGNYSDIVASLIRVMSLLSKATFNKVIGVEPQLIKGFLKVLPQILSSIVSKSSKEIDIIVLNIIKSLGIFYSLGALVPNKSNALYKTIIEIEYL